MSLFIGPSLIFLYELVYFFNRYTGYLPGIPTPAQPKQVSRFCVYFVGAAALHKLFWSTPSICELLPRLAEINHEKYNSNLCPSAGAILRDHAAPARARRCPEGAKTKERARGDQDAKMLAKNMIKQLPASRHGEAGEAIAEAFLVEAKMQK